MCKVINKLESTQDFFKVNEKRKILMIPMKVFFLDLEDLTFHIIFKLVWIQIIFLYKKVLYRPE